MKNRLLSLLIMMLITYATAAQNSNRWLLVWSDEFESDNIDWTYWSKVPRGTPEWKRHASNFDSLYAVEDGNLVLRAMSNTTQSGDTAQYITGDVWGLDKKCFGFGRIEIRAKIDCAQGFWPAIWMLPQANNRRWPDDGEIDIMEHLNHDSVVYQTVHSHYTHNPNIINKPQSSCVFPYKPNEYNIYAVERYLDSIVFFVNNQRTFCYKRIKAERDRQFPFSDNPFYLILSAQLGGNWVGEIKAEQLPAAMYVDYVRYYQAADASLIPFPKEYELRKGKAKQLKKVKYLSKSNKYLPLPTNREEYYLLIKNGKVWISGNEVYARHTLTQLTDENGTIPNVFIHDWPTYPFRAFMHDTGRNYQSVEMLKQTLDLMSFYKLNFFHWHLTDHPAWRIECKAYPQLNDARFQRQGRDEGQFYTYDEIREVIAYAGEKGITVVPEIDMPEHSTYFNNTFGFSMDSEEGKKVLETCLEEFFEEIPQKSCPYFHIGSDEIHIADPQGFMHWIEALMEKHHRQAIAWDPGLPASENTIRQIWNEAAGSNAAASLKSGKYLDSFVGYLNYYDPMVFTNRIFLHTAAAQTQADTSKALGGILCLWNDVRVDEKKNIALHNGMINGMMTFSERFWNGGNAGSDIVNANVLPHPFSEAGLRLSAFENRMIQHRERFLHDYEVRWVANANIPWLINIGTQHNIRAWGGAIDMDALCAVNQIEKVDSLTATAQTHIWVDHDTLINAWVGFEAPARSNRISGGIGPQKHWENQGRVWVNEVEVFPETEWEEPQKYAYHFNTWMRAQEEEPYTNEQLYWMRKPVLISLKKGLNIIQLETPKTFPGQRWSFAFIPISLDSNGKVSEAKGIIFQQP